MLTQETIVFAVVTATAALLVWRGVRRRRVKIGTCCGCSGSAGNAKPQGMVLKARKNGPVQIGFK